MIDFSTLMLFSTGGVSIFAIYLVAVWALTKLTNKGPMP